MPRSMGALSRKAVSGRRSFQGSVLRLAIFSCALASIIMALYGAAPKLSHEDLVPAVPTEPGAPASVSAPKASVVLLVALEEGGAGRAALAGWSYRAGSKQRKLPPVWILCSHNSTLVAAVRQTPHLHPFLVDARSSWANTLHLFLSENEHASIVGLFGEGSLPHRDLAASIESMSPALSKATAATAILARSRSLGNGFPDGRWLSDKFIAQVWCNRAMLGSERLVNLRAAVPSESERIPYRLQDATLLQLLPILLKDGVEGGGSGAAPPPVLVDGTQFLRSTFRPTSYSRKKGQVWGTREEVRLQALGDGAGGNLPQFVGIGSLDHALVVDGGLAGHGNHTVKTSSISKAPWPPEYVLETVANEDGLVIVTSANCGYLDMAVNFLRSVQRTTDSKVLLVAVDRVSFDFLDALAPGCVAVFTSEPEIPQSTVAGHFGDWRFSTQVLMRPSIAKQILEQGFTVFWNDADMVWLHDPLPLLPDIHDPSAADVMLQHDGLKDNLCTCFLFLRPTLMTRTLMERWHDNIVLTREKVNQLPFQAPVSILRAFGLRVAFVGEEAVPSGKDFFYNDHLSSYEKPPNAVMVHNNWVIGHGLKKHRFQRHGLWSVTDVSFPQCGRRWFSQSHGVAASPAGLLNKVLPVVLTFLLAAWCVSHSTF